jgi:hypothetical protein
MSKRKEPAVYLGTDYKPGDPPPPNHAYVEWFNWAQVQDRAGIKQRKCPKCLLWWYPQEGHDFKNCTLSRSFAIIPLLLAAGYQREKVDSLWDKSE